MKLKLYLKKKKKRPSVEKNNIEALIWRQNIRKNGYCLHLIQSIKIIGVSLNNSIKWNETENNSLKNLPEYSVYKILLWEKVHSNTHAIASSLHYHTHYTNIQISKEQKKKNKFYYSQHEKKSAHTKCNQCDLLLSFLLLPITTE